MTRRLSQVEATRELLDWTQGAMLLQEPQANGHRHWTPLTVESNVFYRAKLSLLQF